MKTFLVVTSIAPPTPAMERLAEGALAHGWPLLCVGDQSSPHEYKLEGCRFLSLGDQRQLPFGLAGLAPVRHYSRKNLGYLVAAAGGADIVVETDDDNSPTGLFWAARPRRVCGRSVREAGWVNAYAYFTPAPIWPRGFPLESLHDPVPRAASSEGTDCPIQQGLADGDPDVDAVYRLTRELPIRFEDAPPLILEHGSWCPFNSQNTIWWREAFPLLYLPSSCSFRMTDIWRSFVAQRCAWAAGWSMAFHSPSVFQDRNEHNLLKDFDQEVSGYLNNARIAHALGALDLPPGRGNLLPNLCACYEALVRLGVIAESERPLLEAWCRDMEKLGF